MSIFLSIFAATCRPHNITHFLDNLKNTADDYSSFEVLLKLDEDADDMAKLIEDYKQSSPLNIKYLKTATLDGYYSLDVGYNELLKIADPETYFCWLLTDEIRLETQGWDTILKKQIGFYPDDIFRIKLSIFQLKNYNDFFECLPCPDNYAVTTRKWLEITGGWGNFWGPDSWHQCVDYYLGLCKNKDNPYGIWRSYPLFDIKVGGQEAGQGIEDPKKLRERARKIWRGWARHSTHAAQENFKRLAQRLNAHIVAHSQKLNEYTLTENLSTKTITLMGSGQTRQHIDKWSYQLPRLQLRFFLGNKKIKLIHLIPFLAIYHRKVKYYCNIAVLLRLPKKLSAIIYRSSIKKIIQLPRLIINLLELLLDSPYYSYRILCLILRSLTTIFRKFCSFFMRSNTRALITYNYNGKSLIINSPNQVGTVK